MRSKNKADDAGFITAVDGAKLLIGDGNCICEVRVIVVNAMSQCVPLEKTAAKLSSRRVGPSRRKSGTFTQCFQSQLAMRDYWHTTTVMSLLQLKIDLFSQTVVPDFDQAFDSAKGVSIRVWSMFTGGAPIRLERPLERLGELSIHESWHGIELCPDTSFTSRNYSQKIQTVVTRRWPVNDVVPDRFIENYLPRPPAPPLSNHSGHDAGWTCEWIEAITGPSAGGVRMTHSRSRLLALIAVLGQGVEGGGA
ncbi:hypothetical protein C8Q74DRAFT_1434883 [Fomes fomentarius]|nr:hypothetical protein C8Q74DRAFT_1434883 [Fomes fomentarius]